MNIISIFHNFDSSLSVNELLIFIIKFFIYLITVFFSIYLREKIKVFIEKQFIRNLITKEKRSKPPFYFVSTSGLFLFLTIGVGYSNSRYINYNKYPLSINLSIIFSGLITSLFLSIVSYYLYNSDFYLNKYLIFKIFLSYLCYVNFILVIINLLPFPFSDTILTITFFNKSIYHLEVFQIILVIIFSVLNFHTKIYNLYINFLKQILF